MLLSDVRKYLKALEDYENISVISGAVDSNNEKSIGIFLRQHEPVVAVGTDSSYNILPVTFLVHWTESTDSCESAANDLLDLFYKKYAFKMNNKDVYFANVLDSTPIDISRDDQNICEMVVRVDFYYER